MDELAQPSGSKKKVWIWVGVVAVLAAILVLIGSYSGLLNTQVSNNLLGGSEAEVCKVGRLWSDQLEGLYSQRITEGYKYHELFPDRWERPVFEIDGYRKEITAADLEDVKLLVVTDSPNEEQGSRLLNQGELDLLKQKYDEGTTFFFGAGNRIQPGVPAGVDEAGQLTNQVLTALTTDIRYADPFQSPGDYVHKLRKLPTKEMTDKYPFLRAGMHNYFLGFGGKYRDDQNTVGRIEIANQDLADCIVFASDNPDDEPNACRAAALRRADGTLGIYVDGDDGNSIEEVVASYLWWDATTQEADKKLCPNPPAVPIPTQITCPSPSQCPANSPSPSPPGEPHTGGPGEPHTGGPGEPHTGGPSAPHSGGPHT